MFVVTLMVRSALIRPQILNRSISLSSNLNWDGSDCFSTMPTSLLKGRQQAFSWYTSDVTVTSYPTKEMLRVFSQTSTITKVWVLRKRKGEGRFRPKLFHKTLSHCLQPFSSQPRIHHDTNRVVSWENQHHVALFLIPKEALLRVPAHESAKRLMEREGINPTAGCACLV